MPYYVTRTHILIKKPKSQRNTRFFNCTEISCILLGCLRSINVQRNLKDIHNNKELHQEYERESLLYNLLVEVKICIFWNLNTLKFFSPPHRIKCHWKWKTLLRSRWGISRFIFRILHKGKDILYVWWLTIIATLMTYEIFASSLLVFKFSSALLFLCPLKKTAHSSPVKKINMWL